MAVSDNLWYQLIGENKASINKSVQCDTFATAISVEEMKDVYVTCVIPIIKMFLTSS